MTVTVQQLAQQIAEASAAYRRAESDWEHARDKRDDLIRSALAQGWSLAQVGAAANLTRGRIAQIKTGSG